MASRRGHVPRGTRVIVVIAGAALAVVLWSEVIHARAARRRLGAAPRATGRGVVVVLGFSDSGERPNQINRWRARLALRSARPGSTTIVTSGGCVRGSVPEATLLARSIRALGWTGPILEERESTTTWENVRNVLPALEQADWIVFASNGLHAEKAREYLFRQRPDLAARLVRGDDYRFGEMFHVKPFFAAVGLFKLRSLH